MKKEELLAIAKEKYKGNPVVRCAYNQAERKILSETIELNTNGNGDIVALVDNSQVYVQVLYESEKKNWAEIIEKPFTLPEKWAVKICSKETKEMAFEYGSELHKYLVCYKGNYYTTLIEDIGDCTIITVNQFIENVYKPWKAKQRINEAIEISIEAVTNAINSAKKMHALNDKYKPKFEIGCLEHNKNKSSFHTSDYFDESKTYKISLDTFDKNSEDLLKHIYNKPMTKSIIELLKQMEEHDDYSKYKKPFGILKHTDDYWEIKDYEDTCIKSAISKKKLDENLTKIHNKINQTEKINWIL